MEFFHGAQLRLNRAGEHLADLKARIEVFRQEYVDRFVAHFDPKTEQIALGVDFEKTGEPWPTLSLLVGEITYNLRAALDYMVYELALVDSGEPQSGTQFPIEDTPEGFAGRRNTYLKGISDEHVALIDRLQPYKGCKWTKLLRSLSNPDKHRHLILLTNLSEARVIVRKGNFRAFNDVTSGKVFRTETGPNPGEVHVDLDVSLQIAFDDESIVMETLEVLQLKIAEVLEEFKANLG